MLVTIQVDPGFHITDLKNKFFSVEVEPNDYLAIAQVDFPPGVPEEDELVYKGLVELKVSFTHKQPLAKAVTFNFTVSFQICQERPVAMCFAPDSIQVSVTLAPGFASARGKRQSLADWVKGLIAKFSRALTAKGPRPVWLYFLTMLLGFITSLTPCVYPVIPIVMSYVGASSRGRKARGFLLSLFFVLGLALVYSLLGMIAALAGSMLGAAFQSPVMIVFISAVFILMGLSMAGLFTITPPASLSARLGQGGRRGWLTALLLGGISALIAAPCAGPVIGTLLTWIATSRDIIGGFLLMLAFSLGMGIIFLLVGTFTGIVTSLPKGGKWMERIKYFFALVMIGAGIAILGPVAAAWIKLLLWGVYVLALGVFLKPFHLPEDADFSRKLRQVLALLLVLLGAFLVWRGLDRRYLLAPFTGTAAPAGPVPAQALSRLPWLADIDEALARAQKENRRILIDTTADWCVACRELEEKTYSRPEVEKALEGFILVKLDFTDNRSEKSKALARRFAIIGNPTVIFLASDGRELSRFSGFVPADDFLGILGALGTH